MAADRFENPDDEVRVVRNLYIVVSLWVDVYIEIEALSPRGTTIIVTSVGHSSRMLLQWLTSVGYNPLVHYICILIFLGYFLRVPSFFWPESENFVLSHDIGGFIICRSQIFVLCLAFGGFVNNHSGRFVVFQGFGGFVNFRLHRFVLCQNFEETVSWYWFVLRQDSEGFVGYMYYQNFVLVWPAGF